MDTNQLLDLIHSTQTLALETPAFIERLRGEDIVGETDLFARLVRSACVAGTQANAVISGHQVAIRRLFPVTPDIAITAFCVSETRGPHPRYIQTQLRESASGYTITGEKMWGTMAPPADVLYVAASLGEVDGQNQLRMVGVASGHSSITQVPLPPEREAGDVPICDLKFDATPVLEGHVFAEDAYTAFIKPFRLLEDVYSTLAMQIVLYRLGAQTGLSHAQREDLLALIVQGHAVTDTDMASSASILLITSYLRASQRHWRDMRTEATAQVSAGWQFGRPILKVAERARTQRRSNAWTALGEPLPESETRD